MELSKEIDYSEYNATNPTLNQLIIFTRVHWYRFADIDLTVITEYDKTTRESGSNGRYYLYGQLPVLPDTPITRQMLDDANSIHLQRIIDYGEPYNAAEASSIQYSERLYHQLIHIIKRYRIVYEDIIHNRLSE